ncbi:hypothetical protein [Rhodospirillum rubrum]|uniref:Uncharacterized protein n=1 Tax=Rhodospirillum rubrum (strain ATCC 11170 / ATH 1.1.1 / DSM 467 / LMG 4362 / NCIMB 8255 / S1) TaxID=269796 RepID=Q2RSK3_RHORT|nr:hypothetical protein [Rhodospirillum rubrum]ABC22892.1 hypothetical protein Rru_A2092 [Rhodospirillum rubrum ATCC 11170]AEO48615.1 hypothetical protein F11_10755 [Rhodospirillum rubrum F11]MBK5954497.1 hypothetical protein [Rhodospirillum rubrum]QXG78880.1 hypothetical protein KUL73_10820 [Rhodospirillum rubrum]HCF18837.1 hypothetical protein [Rhodospirillum rubrum]
MAEIPLPSAPLASASTGLFKSFGVTSATAWVPLANPLAPDPPRSEEASAGMPVSPQDLFAAALIAAIAPRSLPRTALASSQRPPLSADQSPLTAASRDRAFNEGDWLGFEDGTAPPTLVSRGNRAYSLSDHLDRPIFA